MKFVLVLSLLFSQLVFAGSMKEIDFLTREIVSNTYYQGDDPYNEYMFNEIWAVNLEDGIENKCLVTVTGMATTFKDYIGVNKFWVCINRDDKGSFSGYLLKDEVIE